MDEAIQEQSRGYSFLLRFNTKRDKVSKIVPRIKTLWRSSVEKWFCNIKLITKTRRCNIQADWRSRYTLCMRRKQPETVYGVEVLILVQERKEESSIQVRSMYQRKRPGNDRYLYLKPENAGKPVCLNWWCLLMGDCFTRQDEPGKDQGVDFISLSLLFRRIQLQ